MNELDPNDRIADHALRRAHAETVEPDLAPRIVAAWERGERGPDVAALVEAERARLAEETVEIADDVELVPRRRWPLYVVAGLAAAGIAAWILVRGGEDGAPSRTSELVARASEPLRVFRGAEYAELATTEVLPDDRVLLGDAQVAWLEPASGARVVLGPCALVEFGSRAVADAFALHRGRLEATSGARALVVDAGFALVLASPSSRFRVEIALDETTLACAPVHGPEGLRELLARLPNEPRVLRVGVTSGGVEIEHDGVHETLAAGAAREIFGPSSPGRLVSERGKQETLARVEALQRGPKYDPMRAVPMRELELGLAKDLVQLLERSPQYWPVVASELSTRVAKRGLTRDATRRFVVFALMAPPREGVPLVRSLWRASPESFAEEDVVELAERGLPEFEREVIAMVEQHDGPLEKAPVLAAAYLSARGHAPSAALLERYVDEPRERVDSAIVERVALAGFSLDSAGDPRAWRRAVEAVAPGIERMIANGNWMGAGWSVLALRYLHEARARNEIVTPTRFRGEIGAFAAAHEEELVDAASLRRALTDLRR